MISRVSVLLADAAQPARRARGEEMPGKNANHYCMAIAPPELSDEAKQALDISNRRAALLNDFRWQPGNTLTIRFMEGDPGLQQRVRQAAEGWLTDAATGQRLANLQFSFVPAGFAHVRIAFQQGAGSWSQIGTACNQVPQ